MRVLAILFFLFPILLSAQVKQKKTYVVYLNYADQTIKADVLSEPKKINVNEKLTYYWYSSNKIMETQGGYDGKILNGSYSSFYLSKNLKEKGSFKNGLKNSKWTTWSDGGKMMESVTWKNGLKSGKTKEFNTAGELVEESEFKNGLKDGYQISYTAGAVSKREKYKKGVLVPLKDTGKDSKGSKQTSGKRKWMFWKKDPAQKNPAKKDEKGKPASSSSDKEKKPKKSFKERWSSLFKKKESSEKKSKPAGK